MPTGPLEWKSGRLRYVDITWHHIFTGWIRIFNRPTPVWNVDSQRKQPWRQAEANDGIDRTCPPEKGCNAHVQCLPDEYLGLGRSKYCLKIGTESPLDSSCLIILPICNSHAVAVGVYLLFWDKTKLFVNTSWVTSSGCVVVCQGPHVQVTKGLECLYWISSLRVHATGGSLLIRSGTFAPGIAWTATSVPHIVTAYLLHNKPIGPAATAQQVAPGGCFAESLNSYPVVRGC